MNGKVTITPVAPRGRALALSYNGPAEPGGGIGGWADVQRPLRSTAKEWEGIPSETLRVPFMMNGISGDGEVSVEAAINRLYEFGRPTTSTKRPPVLQLAGPIPHRGLRWILQDVEWGSDYVINAKGQRVQQAGVLILDEYAAADVLLTPARKANTRKKERRYTVKRSDLRQGLSGIAARELGSAGRWREIAKLNGIRDPMRIRAGQSLRLP